MIYLLIFSIYSLGLMGFILLSYILWLHRAFKEDPVGFLVSFNHLGQKHHGRVIGHLGDTLYVRCDKGVRYRYISKELCKPCLFRNFK